MKNLTLNKSLKITAAATAVIGTLWMGIAFADSHGPQGMDRPHSPWSSMSMLSERGGRNPETQMNYVFDQIGLTEEQRAALLPIMTAFGESTEAEREAHRAEMQTEMADFKTRMQDRNEALRTEHRDRLVAELSTVLSADQLAELESYMDAHPMQRPEAGQGRGRDGGGHHRDGDRGPRYGK
jgi:Spy/CpxP family protein refolding chaperone